MNFDLLRLLAILLCIAITQAAEQVAPKFFFGPTKAPSRAPTHKPTYGATKTPTFTPTLQPTPTISPSYVPTISPTLSPTVTPTLSPTLFPTLTPSLAPSLATKAPTFIPTSRPTPSPTSHPTPVPTSIPTSRPTSTPTSNPTYISDKSVTVFVMQDFDTIPYNTFMARLSVNSVIIAKTVASFIPELSFTDIKVIEVIDDSSMLMVHYSATLQSIKSTNFKNSEHFADYYVQTLDARVQDGSFLATLKAIAVTYEANYWGEVIDLTEVDLYDVEVAEPTSSDGHHVHLTKGAIAGIVIGAIAFFVVVFGSIYLFVSAWETTEITESEIFPPKEDHSPEHNDVSLEMEDIYAPKSIV